MLEKKANNQSCIRLRTRFEEFSSEFSSMKWIRGDIIGEGSYSTVRLARAKNPSPHFPGIMAVKSSSTHADMLLHEKSMLAELKDCPYIIRCFGDDHSTELGEKTYNLLLEYAAGGTLADKLKYQTHRRFQESEIQRYTKSILEGVKYIHEKGYVHRDLKLENILVCSSSKDSAKNNVKIADFGLARRAGEKKKRGQKDLKGTLLYMSPEAVAHSEQEPPADVWAVGCIVVKMFSGLPVWQVRPGENRVEFMKRIGLSDELPEISGDLSPIARDFLEKIFIKDPSRRWTAQMLLDHPFVVDQPCQEDEATLFPNSPRGLLNWRDGYKSGQASHSVTKTHSRKLNKDSGRLSMMEKIRRLVKCQGRDWAVSR